MDDTASFSASATAWKWSPVAIAEDVLGRGKRGMCHRRQTHTKIQTVQMERCLCSV